MSRFLCLLAVFFGLVGTLGAQDSGSRIMRNLEYVPGGHERHRLDLYLPEKSDASSPVVIWLHGGGWIRGDKANNHAAPLVAKGYAAVSMNYRFLQHAEFPAQIEDCKAAVRWVRANAKKYNLDPNRIGVMGASAGGHLAALLGTTASVKDLEGALGNADQSSRVQAVVDLFGPLRITKEKGNKSNVLSYVTKDACPFLIVHGDADKSVSITQSEQLTAALKKAGVEATMIPLKGAGHSGPEFFTEAMMATYQQFFDTHLVAQKAKPEAAQESPTDWIDPATGHRVIRLSPAGGGGSLYFHQNTYTPEGDKMIFNSKGAIVAVDLRELGVKPPKVDVVTPGSAIAMAFKSREVYFAKGKGGKGAIYAAHVDTKAVREVKNARGGTINADETFSVVAQPAVDPTGNTPKPAPRKLLPQRERMFGDKLKLQIPLTPAEELSAEKEQRLAAQLANPISRAFTFTNLKTGEAMTVGYSYAWLNHMQFSPTDPNLLLFCHEGTWHEVDRVWTIRTDGSDMKLIHKRTMDMEIAGHEFWSHDGKTIWFDLQAPRSQQFWLAGVNIATGAKVRYSIARDHWSVHFNTSRDGKLFAGDGGDPGQVAFAKDGQWIYAFTPQNADLKKSPDGWLEGTFKVERLVSMAKHNYKMEPNVTITPDGKWVVFRSNMHGASHVYAAEVRKSK